MYTKEMEDRIAILRCSVKYRGISCKHCKRIDEEAYSLDKDTLMELRQEYLNSTTNLNWSRLSFYLTSKESDKLLELAEDIAEATQPDIDGVHYITCYNDLFLYDGESTVIWNYPSTNELLNDIMKYERVYDSFKINVKDISSSGLLNKTNLIIGDIPHEEFMKKFSKIVEDEHIAGMSIPFYVNVEDGKLNICVYKEMRKLIDSNPSGSIRCLE